MKKNISKRNLTIIGLKPVRQSPGLCGPAALRVVLKYYGLEVSEKKLAKLAGASQRKGTTIEGLIKAAKALGFKVLLKDNSSLSELTYFIKQKMPVIVDWFDQDDGHYSVVSRLMGNRIFLMNSSSLPAEVKEISMPTSKFMRIWFDFPGSYLKDKKEIILRRMIVLIPIR
jgi:ABC-type bacteriocin/lantibiotic exporter with double-glycine peptidase domain